MKDFLKGILASALGFGLALGAGLLALVILAVALAQGGGDASKAGSKVRPGTFLVIGNGLAVTDTPDDGSVSLGSLLSDGGESVDLWRALEAIDLASRDKAITGILLADGLSAGLATRNELRQAIEAFAKQGKPVIAWMESPRVGDYWMGSAGTTVVLHPAGEITFAGLASYSSYMGDTLRQLGIGVQVTKVGQFKSAVEPFTESRMSEPARRQMQELLDEIWGRLVADTAKSRSLGEDRLRELAAKPGHFGAAKALEARLVDKVMHRDELVSFLVEAGAEADGSGSFRQVGLARYAAKTRLPRGKDGKLALVYAEGDIVDGMGGAGSVGGDRLASVFRHLRHDDEVKAVVLRINSPGGSAYASEVMHREIELLRAKGVPIVVSMGDMAASGGYYIAAPGTTVVADPLTITGSIGVFGLHFNYGGVAERFALGTDGVKTAPYADLLDLHRPATEAELAIVQSSVDGVYETFLGVVGRGRGMQRDAVHEVAQGRVWSGARARQLGLVDRLGGLRDALALAAEKADAGKLELVQVPSLGENRRSLVQALMEEREPAPLFAGIARDPALAELRARWRSLKALRHLNDRRGIYLIGPVGVEAR
jgi:protease IV